MPFRNPVARRAYNRAYLREHYRRHKAAYIEKNRVRKRQARRFLGDIKRLQPCAHCGEDDVRCLDFHHLSHHKKNAGLSELATDGAAIETLKRELEKCIVLCKNCHAKQHLKGPLDSA